MRALLDAFIAWILFVVVGELGKPLIFLLSGDTERGLITILNTILGGIIAGVFLLIKSRYEKRVERQRAQDLLIKSIRDDAKIKALEQEIEDLKRDYPRHQKRHIYPVHKPKFDD